MKNLLKILRKNKTNSEDVLLSYASHLGTHLPLYHQINLRDIALAEILLGDEALSPNVQLKILERLDSYDELVRNHNNVHPEDKLLLYERRTALKDRLKRMRVTDEAVIIKLKKMRSSKNESTKKFANYVLTENGCNLRGKLKALFRKKPGA